MPRVEAGEVAVVRLSPRPTGSSRWLELAPRIGEDLFLKLYGHRAREDNAGALLGLAPGAGSLAPMFRWIAEEAQRQNLELHLGKRFSHVEHVDALVNMVRTPPGGG